MRDGFDEVRVFGKEPLQPVEKSLRIVHVHCQDVVEAGSFHVPKRAQGLASVRQPVPSRSDDGIPRSRIVTGFRQVVADIRQDRHISPHDEPERGSERSDNRCDGQPDE